MPAQTIAHINIYSLCSFENIQREAVYLIFPQAHILLSIYSGGLHSVSAEKIVI